ncbi:MAG TPA: PaaI family thioesterase [Flavobacteriales bacterium]|nr:PaaI family thioesterase [Flavobacteriales bacterium]
MPQNLLKRYIETNHFGRENKMEYTFIEPGKVEYHFTPQQKHMATATAIHGGAIAGFMDGLLGGAALTAVYEEGKVVTTVEFKINFLAPVYPEIPLKGTAQVIYKGKSTLVVTGNIVDNQGQLIATGLGTLKSYTPMSNS